MFVQGAPMHSVGRRTDLSPASPGNKANERRAKCGRGIAVWRDNLDESRIAFRNEAPQSSTRFPRMSDHKARAWQDSSGAGGKGARRSCRERRWPLVRSRSGFVHGLTLECCFRSLRCLIQNLAGDLAVLEVAFGLAPGTNGPVRLSSSPNVRGKLLLSILWHLRGAFVRNLC